MKRTSRGPAKTATARAKADAAGVPGGTLRLTLLGGLRIARGPAGDETPVRGFVSGKAQALLCYLAVTGRPHFREALAGLLWGELPDEDARANLRQALANLRPLVGPHLTITRETVAFDRASPYWLDVERFEAHLHDAAATAAGAAGRLRAAVELYGGDFLEGFAVRDAPAFEEWVAAQRERLRHGALQALHELAVYHTDREDYAVAGNDLHRLLELDPWREDAHRQLMLLLARGGQRDAALAQYENCRRLLLDELGVEPSAETRALAEQIRTDAPGQRGPLSRAAQPARPPAERRQLTMLDCALDGFGALAEQLDPEDLHEVVQAWRQVCADLAERFVGRIVQHRADGALLSFGYPLAFEDDAPRAVRAGLALVAAVRELDLPLLAGSGVTPAARVGVHTGLVVVGAGGDTTAMAGEAPTLDAAGLTPATAGRLQESAAPATVAVSAATERLIRGYFTCRPLGERALASLSQPVTVYQVLAESGARSRLDAAASAAGGLTPLVGRGREVAALLARWERARAGKGQLALIGGEPGIGKSRLVRALRERVTAGEGRWLECHCSPHTQNSALAPVIELLHESLGLAPDDAPADRLAALERVLARHGLPVPVVAPPLADLLALPPRPRAAPLAASPQQRKERTFDALLALLRVLAARQPLLLAIEDLHWADPSTLELLDRLLDQAPGLRLCALLTHRPDFRPPWPARPHLTRLTLGHLAPRQAEALVAQVAGDRALPPQMLRQLAATTDGVPLFAEELTRMVLEREDQPVGPASPGPQPGPPPPAIPTTLRDALTARLDRLGAAKMVAQVGATIGRDFSYDVLRAVAPLEAAALHGALDRLAEAGLIVQRDAPSRPTPGGYTFKHALVRDAAYESLPRRERQGYHQRIARLLEERDRATVEARPELLAHHYTAAGLTAQAVGHWLRAGQRAVQRSANLEAIDHLTRGLLLLSTLPDTPQRARQELEFQMALGPALVATQGYMAASVERVYARARQLCRQVGETPQLFPALWGLWLYYTGRADFRTAAELGEELLALAQRTGDPALLLQAHHVLWNTTFIRGELSAALAHAEQGLALYDARRHHAQALLYGGHDPAVCGWSYAAKVRWLQGYPAQALAHVEEALALSRRLGHPFSQAAALEHATMLAQLRRDVPAVQARVEALLALADEQQFASNAAIGTIFRGWALAAQGQVSEGIAHHRRGLAAYEAMGGKEQRPYFLALLAEASTWAGQVEAGLRALEEALAAAEATGERWWEAELYRLQGELLARAGEQAAEATFERALAVARRQEARSLELRAAVSLGRLWRQQGRADDARALLAPLHTWFTEGFDTPDLLEARALLDDVAGASEQAAATSPIPALVSHTAG